MRSSVPEGAFYHVVDMGDLPALDESKPIVWTTIGNINERDLDQFNGNPFKLEWQVVTRESDPNVIDHVVFVKEYYLKGVQVKREAHVLKPNGVESLAEQPTL